MLDVFIQRRLVDVQLELIGNSALFYAGLLLGIFV